MGGVYVPHSHRVAVQVCVHMHVYVYVDTCTYMQKSKTDIRSQLLSTLSPETRLYPSLSLGLAVLARLASQHALGIPCLCLVFLEY